MSVYFFFTSTDKPVTKENVTVFQYSRKMSGNKSKFTPQNFIRRKTINKLSFKRSLVGERKLGLEL